MMKAIHPRRPVNDVHSAKPAGAEFWHVWTVRIPRRSITGGLVWGPFGGVMKAGAGFTRA